MEKYNRITLSFLQNVLFISKYCWIQNPCNNWAKSHNLSPKVRSQYLLVAESDVTSIHCHNSSTSWLIYLEILPSPPLGPLSPPGPLLVYQLSITNNIQFALLLPSPSRIFKEIEGKKYQTHSLSGSDKKRRSVKVKVVMKSLSWLLISNWYFQ